MYGPSILVRTLSKSTRVDRFGNRWQYHSRSDHHSKVACWGVLFDLMLVSPLLRTHITADKVRFGINHEMLDFVHERKKDLDLVLCTTSDTTATSTFAELVAHYQIELSPREIAALNSLPPLLQGEVSSVLMALEAKACMTAHQRALPRFYDELNSSQATVHGASDQAISAGFVMINFAKRYLSPDRNKSNRMSAPEWSSHTQPRDAQITINKVSQLPRRSRTSDPGYDALAIVLVDCANDGSPVTLVTNAPAPAPRSMYDYASMIDRLATTYATRFKDL